MSKAPVRVCLSRAKGARLPAGAVNVARPSKWGNPFVVGPNRTQAEAVTAYRVWLTNDTVHAGLPGPKYWILQHLPDLRGRDLACWCKPGEPCHADVLLELANQEPS